MSQIEDAAVHAMLICADASKQARQKKKTQQKTVIAFDSW